MKKIYRKPSVIRYEQDEVVEMMGPVRTQYPCECNTYIPPVVQKSDVVQLGVNVSGQCPDFDRVTFTLTQAAGPGLDPDYTFLRVDATPAGNLLVWTIPGILGQDLVEGDYCFTAELFLGGESVLQCGEVPVCFTAE